jgi:hypothetical protein
MIQAPSLAQKWSNEMETYRLSFKLLQKMSWSTDHKYVLQILFLNPILKKLKRKKWLFQLYSEQIDIFAIWSDPQRSML